MLRPAPSDQASLSPLPPLIGHLFLIQAPACLMWSPCGLAFHHMPADEGVAFLVAWGIGSGLNLAEAQYRPLCDLSPVTIGCLFVT